MLSLDQLEIFLEDGGTVEQEEAQSIIQENTTNGRVLRTAAEEGRLNTVKFILEAKDHFRLSAEERVMCSNKGAADNDGNTPLHLAALNGHISIVAYIVSTGEPRNIFNRSRETPLYLACRKGHENIVEILRHGAIFNFYSKKDKKSPIEVAAFNGHAGIVLRLLSSGSDRMNALTLAVTAGHEDVFTNLILHFVDTGFLNMDRNTLHEAAKKGRHNMCKILLDAGFHVSLVNSAGVTPLDLAAKYGHFTTVQLLVLHGAVNRSGERLRHGDGFVQTAIDFAIEHGHIRIAHFLFLHGWSLNKGLLLRTMIMKGRMLAMMSVLALGEDLDSFHPRTLIHLACRGKVEMVQYMLQRGASVNFQDKQLNSPLHIACKSGSHASIIKFLILKGANINATNKKGETPLLVTTDFNLQKILIESGADPHIPDRHGITILHKATNWKLVELLLECNVLVDARSLRAITPLMEASYRGNREIAELLIKKGACVNAKDQNGVALLGRALILRLCSIVELLLQNDANVNIICNSRNETALHLACRSNVVDCASLLLKWKAAVNARDDDGNTPLHLAVTTNSVKLVQLLAKFGADVNAVNKIWQTALHLVKTAKIVRLLIDKRANITMKDIYGQTPLECAEKNGNMQVVSALQEVEVQNKRV